MKNPKIWKKVIPAFIAPLIIEALIAGSIVVAGHVIIGEKIKADVQAKYEDWEQRQRAIEIIDAWCAAHGIVPEELEPRGVDP